MILIDAIQQDDSSKAPEVVVIEAACGGAPFVSHYSWFVFLNVKEIFSL